MNTACRGWPAPFLVPPAAMGSKEYNTLAIPQVCQAVLGAISMPGLPKYRITVDLDVSGVLLIAEY